MSLEKNSLLKQHGVIYEGRYLVPLATLVPILANKDDIGFKQLILSEVTALSVTDIIKNLTRERRPNGHCCKSFPSGHASAVFAASSFIQFRYGVKYSIPFYIASGFVAYQRVHSKSHYLHDVIAGSIIGIASGYLSTTDKNHFNVYYDGKVAGIIYRKLFD